MEQEGKMLKNPRDKTNLTLKIGTAGFKREILNSIRLEKRTSASAFTLLY